MVEAIIFDCFGVVITDGLDLYVQQIETERPEARSRISEIIRRNNSGLISPDESSREIADYLGITPQAFRALVAEGEVRNEGLLQWIRDLRSSYKTAMLSNIGKGSLDRRFTADELNKLFDVVVASGEVGVIKPEPEIYQLTAERLGVACQNCVFYDDLQSHIDGALAAGMPAFLFTTTDQAKADLDALLAK